MKDNLDFPYGNPARHPRPLADVGAALRRFMAVAVMIMVASLSLTTHAQEPFKRGLQQISFVPKGEWITGVSVSYSKSNQENYQFFIVENINGDTYSFRVSPMAMYCFKDNLAAGARFAYSRSKINLKTADVVLDSETEYNLEGLFLLTHSYYGTAAFRNYISLGNNRRFGLFNEVQFSIGGGQSKLCNGTGADLTGTYSTNFDLNIGLAPGVVMFLNNYTAIEVNVGVLGFNYSETKPVTDQIYVANIDRKSANFKINLFSISFGVAFYL